MKRYMAKYKGEWWIVETIFFKENNNARIRIGRHHPETGEYEWELVFEKDVELNEDSQS